MAASALLAPDLGKIAPQAFAEVLSWPKGDVYKISVAALTAAGGERAVDTFLRSEKPSKISADERAGCLGIKRQIHYH